MPSSRRPRRVSAAQSPNPCPTTPFSPPHSSSRPRRASLCHPIVRPPPTTCLSPSPSRRPYTTVRFIRGSRGTREEQFGTPSLVRIQSTMLSPDRMKLCLAPVADGTCIFDFCYDLQPPARTMTPLSTCSQF